MPVLQISPIESYIDEDVRIRVIGCTPNTELTIQATTYDEEGKKFSSYATFIANEEGIVDTTSQKPIKGTYNEVDGSGLFWSMKHVESRWDDYYVKSNSENVSFNLDLIEKGEKIDSLTMIRYFYTAVVKKEEIRLNKLMGTLFQPKSEGRYPAAIILSGSDGGFCILLKRGAIEIHKTRCSYS